MLKARYSVVLKSDLPESEEELLEEFALRVRLDSGDELLHLLCTEIDLSHHYLIQMKTFKPEEERTHPLSIPHHYVFAISGADAESPIGFLAGTE